MRGNREIAVVFPNIKVCEWFRARAKKRSLTGAWHLPGIWYHIPVIPLRPSLLITASFSKTLSRPNRQAQATSASAASSLRAVSPILLLCHTCVRQYVSNNEEPAWFGSCCDAYEKGDFGSP